MLSRDSFVSLTHCIKLYPYRLINTCMYAYWDNDTQSLQHKTFCTPDLEVPRDSQRDNCPHALRVPLNIGRSLSLPGGSRSQIKLESREATMKINPGVSQN